MHSSLRGTADQFALWRSTAAQNGQRRPLATQPDPTETVLPHWLVASLGGIALGLTIAKYSQAWAQAVLHPAAVWGSSAIAVSMALPIVVVARYLMERLDPAPLSGVTRTLMSLSVALVVLVGWAALMMIWLAGWEFPPRRSQ